MRVGDRVGDRHPGRSSSMKVGGASGQRSPDGRRSGMVKWRARVTSLWAVSTVAIFCVFAQLLIFIIGKKW